MYFNIATAVCFDVRCTRSYSVLFRASRFNLRKGQYKLVMVLIKVSKCYISFPHAIHFLFTLNTTILLELFLICNFAWSPLFSPALLTSNTTSSLGVNPRRFRFGVFVLPILKLEFREGGGVFAWGGVLPALLPLLGDDDMGWCSASVIELPVWIRIIL